MKSSATCAYSKENLLTSSSFSPGYEAWIRGQVQNQTEENVSGVDVATKEVYKKKRKFLLASAGTPEKRPFHAPHTDFFSTQTPKTVLQKYLWKGEFPPFQHVAMFESNFLQVTRKGKHIFFHNHYHEAIIGIASTNMKLPLPNLMFIARPAGSQVSSEQYPEELMLTRLLPLKFVHISIYDSEKKLIKIKLINGRSYYLQLYTSTEEEKDLFNRWLSLVHLLHHPPRCYLQPQPKSCKQVDELSIDIEVISSEEEVDHARRHSPKKKKEQKGEAAKSQSLDSITQETYTDYEKIILQTPFTRNEWSLEEVESYRGSSAAVRKPAKIYSSESATLSSSLSSTLSSLSSTSLPPRKIPEMGKHGSLNIVTIFSVISKMLEEEKRGNRKN